MTLAIKQLMGRYEACVEAAEHLKLSWTDDDDEYEEGKYIIKQLYKQADFWLLRANLKEKTNA